MRGKAEIAYLRIVRTHSAAAAGQPPPVAESDSRRRRDSRHAPPSIARCSWASTAGVTGVGGISATPPDGMDVDMNAMVSNARSAAYPAPHRHLTISLIASPAPLARNSAIVRSTARRSRPLPSYAGVSIAPSSGLPASSMTSASTLRVPTSTSAILCPLRSLRPRSPADEVAHGLHQQHPHRGAGILEAHGLLLERCCLSVLGDHCLGLLQCLVGSGRRCLHRRRQRGA